MGHSLRDRHVFSYIDIFSCHDAPGAVLRIVQKLIDKSPVRSTDCIKDAVDQICRQLFEHIHGIIHVQVIQKFLQFFFGKHFHQIRLHGTVHIGKYFRCFIFRDQAESQSQLFVVKLREK